MKILISVSDQVWGRKDQYVIDAIIGLLAYGHAVCPAVEEGGTMAAELTRRVISQMRVSAFCANPREAAEADVRWRDETGSGFVFVPVNSPNTELPATNHLLVKAVLTAQRAEDPLKLSAGRDRDLVNLFYAVGALVPNRPKAMC
ncbi:hypothetical protein EV284_0380 [Streptomyces sp. BK022]|uniref:hypothetical protein n=1 Tax=Streptomyces sp. BK022 TaxID=2512123 RepID=UPI001028FA72|nr:hypothetical protein [Streptomyces sp. BK022]RZU45735.1 hypothetical protein EV284_0380 [Streptomyces sp. BK022]